jgi:hypothetical protein
MHFAGALNTLVIVIGGVFTSTIGIDAANLPPEPQLSSNSSGSSTTDFRTFKCKTAQCFAKHPSGTWVHPLTEPQGHNSIRATTTGPSTDCPEDTAPGTSCEDGTARDWKNVKASQAYRARASTLISAWEIIWPKPPGSLLDRMHTWLSQTSTFLDAVQWTTPDPGVVWVYRDDGASNQAIIVETNRLTRIQLAVKAALVNCRKAIPLLESAAQHSADDGGQNPESISGQQVLADCKGGKYHNSSQRNLVSTNKHSFAT